MITAQQETFYKLLLVDIVGRHIDHRRRLLHGDLAALANDPALLSQTFVLLRHLSDYESQVYQKIHCFNGDDANDYLLAIDQITKEIENVVSEHA